MVDRDIREEALRRGYFYEVEEWYRNERDIFDKAEDHYRSVDEILDDFEKQSY